MAIGAFYSLVYFKNYRIVKFLTNNYFFYGVLLLTVSLMLAGMNMGLLHYEFYALLFGIIILNFAVNKSHKIKLENKVFNYLGTISYGIYMYHPIYVYSSVKLFHDSNSFVSLKIYSASFILTILTAALSYRYFEGFFLKFKSRFSS